MKEPRKRIKTQAEIEGEKQNARSFLGPQLPVGEWLAIYARQSTNAQAKDHNELRRFITFLPAIVRPARMNNWERTNQSIGSTATRCNGDSFPPYAL